MSDGTGTSEAKPNIVVRILQTITPNFIRRSFAIKFGLVLVVMALSVGAIGLAATQVLVDQTEANAESEFQGVAGQQADIIEQWIESNSRQTRLLSANEVWDQDASGLVIELENGKLGFAGAVHEMHVVDDEGLGPIVNSSTSLDSDTTFGGGDRQWMNSEFSNVQELEIDDIYVSDTYQQGGERVVAFLSPTAGVNDRYLMVEVSVFGIQQSLRGANPDQDVGFTQVVNTGTYLGDDSTTNNVMIDARGENGKLLDSYASSSEAVEPLNLANDLRDSSEEAGVIARQSPDEAVLDEEYTVGYAPVEVEQANQASITTKEWVVVTHGPRSEVFGLVDALSQWGLIVTGGAVLLIGITGSILGYSTASSIDRLTRKTDEMRDGNLDVDLRTSRIDNIGRLYDGFGEMRDALQQQIQEAESARKEAEVARAEAEELANYLQEKAEEYSQIMQEVSAGDLTQRMTQDGEEESMDQIAEQFNEMIGELEKTTGQLKGYVDEVEEAGSEVEQSAGTVRTASEQVADSIQKISDDAYDQKERLQEISETIDQVILDVESVATEYEGTDIEESLSEIEGVATEINEIVELSQETMAEAENVAGAAEEQAAELNEVSERANDLQRYAAPLRDILGRFETEAEHEFVFSVGPTGGAASPGTDDSTDE